MREKNIATIGGGTGSFTLLSGLKKYPVNISAIVSMADDGGSTGVLRDELGVLPAGDVRQCLVALSNSPIAIRQLFNYRFDAGSLRGHSFGNLFVSALEKTSRNFQEAVDRAGEILNTKGEVIPITETNVELVLKLKNRRVLQGENRINHNFGIQKFGIEKLFLKPKAMLNPRALKAILRADIIVVGPGNLYCSVIPNFLVSGAGAAIRKSKAKVVFVCNLVNKKGHSEGFDLDDYVGIMEKYVGPGRINYVIYNAETPSDRQLKAYSRHSEELVLFNEKRFSKRTFRVIKARVLSQKIHGHDKADAVADIRTLIRHDSDRLAKAIMFVLDVGENKNIISKIV